LEYQENRVINVQIVRTKPLSDSKREMKYKPRLIKLRILGKVIDHI